MIVGMPYGLISFTTDYGLDDPFVGVCHGVIARIAPDVRIIDLTHGVPAGDIRHGCFALAQAVDYLPDAVHLAVVDPGVGTHRRALAVQTERGVLVGPDNGLLAHAADTLGGVVAAVELTTPQYQLPTVSATFHGRDVFAPAAAHLARGVGLDQLGPAVDPAGIERLPTPAATVREGCLVTEVIAVDTFGNIQLAAADTALADAGFGEGRRVTVRVAHVDHPAVVGRTFGDVDSGELLVLGDSAGWIALAVNGGSAATRLRVATKHATHECTITAR